MSPNPLDTLEALADPEDLSEDTPELTEKIARLQIYCMAARASISSDVRVPAQRRAAEALVAILRDPNTPHTARIGYDLIKAVFLSGNPALASILANGMFPFERQPEKLVYTVVPKWPGPRCAEAAHLLSILLGIESKRRAQGPEILSHVLLRRPEVNLILSILDAHDLWTSRPDPIALKQVCIALMGKDISLPMETAEPILDTVRALAEQHPAAVKEALLEAFRTVNGARALGIMALVRPDAVMLARAMRLRTARITSFENPTHHQIFEIIERIFAIPDLRSTWASASNIHKAGQAVAVAIKDTLVRKPLPIDNPQHPAHAPEAIAKRAARAAKRATLAT